MIESGLCIPCQLYKSKGVLVANPVGYLIVDDFKQHVLACEWWNRHICEGSLYKELVGFNVLQHGTTYENHAHQLLAAVTGLTVDVTDKDSGEILMSMEKSSGRINIDTCKEKFREFALDWNGILSGDVRIRQLGTLLERTTDVMSVIVGSIFDGDLNLGGLYGSE